MCSAGLVFAQMCEKHNESSPDTEQQSVLAVLLSMLVAVTAWPLVAASSSLAAAAAASCLG